MRRHRLHTVLISCLMTPSNNLQKLRKFLEGRTGKAIMDLLDRLCREQGKTIVMVTHDPRTAEYAGRIIRIEDGKVMEET